jgi:hypothetical protein
MRRFRFSLLELFLVLAIGQVWLVLIVGGSTGFAAQNGYLTCLFVLAAMTAILRWPM